MPLPDLHRFPVQIVLDVRVDQGSVIVEFLFLSAGVKKLECRDRYLFFLRPNVAVQLIRMQPPKTLPQPRQIITPGEKRVLLRILVLRDVSLLKALSFNQVRQEPALQSIPIDLPEVCDPKLRLRALDSGAAKIS